LVVVAALKLFFFLNESFDIDGISDVVLYGFDFISKYYFFVLNFLFDEGALLLKLRKQINIFLFNFPGVQSFLG